MLRHQWVSAVRAVGLLCGACLLFAASPLLATPLLVNSTLYPASTVGLAGGTNVAAPLTVPFLTPLYSGTLTSTVTSGDAANPLGGYTFTYQLTNNAGSIDAIERLTVNSFVGMLVDAGYLAGGGQAPTYIDRSLAGSTVGFSFIDPPVGPGDLSPGSGTATLVLHTNSLTFSASFASVINGTVATVATYAPVAAIPEPSTFALFGIGALGTTIYLRRQRKLRR